MRVSFVGSSGWFGSVYSSRLPLPFVSRMSAVQPCDFSSSPVSSNIFVFEPADDRAAAARPQRVVRVFGEHQVVRAEARVDVRELLRLRVVHRELSPRSRSPGKVWPTDASNRPCRTPDCRADESST